MLTAIIVVAVPALLLILVGRKLNKRFRFKGRKPVPAEPAPKYDTAEALRRLNNLYESVSSRGANVFREDVIELERCIPVESLSKENFAKLIFLWQRANMTNPRPGQP